MNNIYQKTADRLGITYKQAKAYHIAQLYGAGKKRLAPYNCKMQK